VHQNLDSGEVRKGLLDRGELARLFETMQANVEAQGGPPEPLGSSR
jgi:hypothetical protein